MSGVFGVLDSKRSLRIRALLARMGTKMSHREWYVVETCSDENVGVGLGRIGIGIFNRERQPICSKDQNLMVFLGGEFYNTAELRHGLSVCGYPLMKRHLSGLEEWTIGKIAPVMTYEMMSRRFYD